MKQSSLRSQEHQDIVAHILIMCQLRKQPLLIKVKMKTVMSNLVMTSIAKLPHYRFLSESQATWQAFLLGRNSLKAWANTDPHIRWSPGGLCFLACPQSPESRAWLCKGRNCVPLKAWKGKSGKWHLWTVLAFRDWKPRLERTSFAYTILRARLLEIHFDSVF